jgi:hypothetical protein
MNMLHRTLAAAPPVILALAACQPDEDAPASVCPRTGPVRLAAPPDGWAFDPAAEPKVLDIEDGRIAYTYDARDPAYHWQLDVCGGEPERALDDSVPYRTHLYTSIDDVTYYLNELTQEVLVERDDLDEPQVLAGLPPGAWDAESWQGSVLLTARRTAGNGSTHAAGIGANTRVLYGHDADPSHPAVFLADEVVRYDSAGVDLLALRDDGELLHVDVETGAPTTLVTGVRAFYTSAPYLIWQELGDDVAEPVYLRNLDTGSEHMLLVNDFCQRSWGRDPDFPGSNFGAWRFDYEAGLAARSGPGYQLGAMHRLADGAALEFPAHDRWVSWKDGAVLLETDEPGDIVSFELWDPVTSAEHVWYHGPRADRPAFLTYDGDGLEYLRYTDRAAELGSLWRYELASGEHREVLPRLRSHFARLDDGRYLVHFPTPGVDGAYDLVVIDRDTRSYTTFAGRASSPRSFALDGQLAFAYFDLHGPEPGLWVTPLPPK